MAEPQSPSPLADGVVDRTQAPELCTSCGLCCNGALYPVAALEPEEVEPAAAIGLSILERHGRPCFALPCPKLEDTVCTIFGKRPAVCGRYRCALLNKVIAGGIPRDDAEQRITIGRQLLGDVLSLLPNYLRLPEPKLASVERLAADQGKELRLRATALELFLDKHFRTPKDNKMVIMQPLSDE
jgi:hypothetical protein